MSRFNDFASICEIEPVIKAGGSLCTWILPPRAALINLRATGPTGQPSLAHTSTVRRKV